MYVQHVHRTQHTTTVSIEIYILYRAN